MDASVGDTRDEHAHALAECDYTRRYAHFVLIVQSLSTCILIEVAYYLAYPRKILERQICG
jgi:hypothetical protein